MQQKLSLPDSCAVSKAKSQFDEGEKLLGDRLKLIRNADRSENGWATVEQYMED